MNVPYELWPIWADYLEEQGFDTELLKYVMTWSCFQYFMNYDYFMNCDQINDFGINNLCLCGNLKVEYADFMGFHGRGFRYNTYRYWSDTRGISTALEQ